SHGVHDLARERVGEQGARGILAHAAGPQVEHRLAVDLPHGRPMRALHVVGDDLELRLAADAATVGQQQVAAVRRRLGLLGVVAARPRWRTATVPTWKALSLSSWMREWSRRVSSSRTTSVTALVR